MARNPQNTFRESDVKTFVLSLLFAALMSLSIPGTASAQTWVKGDGLTCAAVCSGFGGKPVTSGTHSHTRTDFHLCRADPGGTGFRPGWNLMGFNPNSCAVAESGTEQYVSTYDCLCSFAAASPAPAPRPKACLRIGQSCNPSSNACCPGLECEGLDPRCFRP